MSEQDKATVRRLRARGFSVMGIHRQTGIPLDLVAAAVGVALNQKAEPARV